MLSGTLRLLFCLRRAAERVVWSSVVRLLFAATLTLVVAQTSRAVNLPIPASERAALLALYAETGGSGWTSNYGWTGYVGSECNWFGVSCYSTNVGLYLDQQSVGVIDLSGNRLKGTLPSLSSLTRLTDLSLSSNGLFGPIPSLTGMSKLRELRLDNNRLTGSIPSLSGLVSVVTLNVQNNDLSGPIPSLAGLTYLSHLSLSMNRLTGSMPSLAGLTNLFDVDLGSNQLSGSIPSLAGLVSLDHITLSSNQLSGPPPPPAPSLRVFGADICGNALQSTGDAAVDYAWRVTTSLPAVNGVLGWIACQRNAVLTLRNPLAGSLRSAGQFGGIDPASVNSADVPVAMSADGSSAVVLELNSALAKTPVTFQTTYGTLTPFHSDYITNPMPGNSPTLSVKNEDFPCTTVPRCTYLGLLWPPEGIPPNSLNSPRLDVKVTAAQAGVAINDATITLQPPPVLFIHGIWSSAAEARFTRGSTGMRDWFGTVYPHSLLEPVDYGTNSYKSFADGATQQNFHESIHSLLLQAASAGVAARQVDVVAHSMGGLVTRYFLRQIPPQPLIPPNPAHRLITVGTPHLGSPLAGELVAHAGDAPIPSSVPSLVACALLNALPCDVGRAFAFIGKRIDTGVSSLIAQPGDVPLNKLQAMKFKGMVGLKPSTSFTNGALNALVSSLTGKSLGTILDPASAAHDRHDTIVSETSQIGGNPVTEDIYTLVDTVHSVLTPIETTGETLSRAAWRQAYTWLTGLPAPAIAAASVASSSGLKALATGADPVLDLSGYTQVAATNVSFAPANAAVLTVGMVANIVATSTTKTIAQVQLHQQVVDPSDSAFLFANAAPFSIPFTPARIGATKFAAIVIFSDNTYAATVLNYTMQAPGAPTALSFVGAPSALRPGMSSLFRLNAAFAATTVDVTALATYVVRSGTGTVFSVGANGTITANGVGVDWLDASYGGLKASAKISVVAPPLAYLDVDGNGRYDPHTDGLLVTRYLLGMTGPALTAGAIGAGANRSDPAAIKTYLDGIRPSLDIDGDGTVNPATDGVLLLRYLLGFRGNQLTLGATAAGTVQTNDQIEAKIQRLAPP